ncbi:hypothetical protein DCAR_0934551 [Daucus carota subsp. sativus]|uniref:GRF-type domain-containing protein n=1 Tax=Daucus carota subsp. sativus TaxID=79200 RepID=A0A175YKS3_DAUCS|nr:PREDICTED: uncharacterized protein LOC108198084 [Daucus carota subsp. sativus]WOH15020.1 hypothetical protein DCAR_0934551 [Daucus carota subsp. sativus]
MNQQCLCGSWAVEKTSWTEYNPRRRFLTCANGRCNFFKWTEPEIDTRSKNIINGLVRRFKLKDDHHFAELIKAKEEYQEFYKEQMNAAKKEARNWKYFAMLLLLYVCRCCFASVGGDDNPA